MRIPDINGFSGEGGGREDLRDWKNISKEELMYELMRMQEKLIRIEHTCRNYYYQKEASSSIVRESIASHINTFNKNKSLGVESWATLYSELMKMCKAKYKNRKSGYQTHHIKPKRDGGKDSGNTVRCNNLEHNMFHFLLYKIEKDEKNLLDIQVNRPTK